jgi:hypothetical protein
LNVYWLLVVVVQVDTARLATPQAVAAVVVR